MVLTLAPRTQSNPDSFPTLQLFILAICRVAEPIALASCFPYAWVMVRDFHVGGKHDASLWAGIFISAFALAESLTGMFWGGLSDRIGRKPVLLIGCAGTMLSLLVVGFATNFWVALAGRAIGGLLNGNIGVIQTMVGELVKKPEHERNQNLSPQMYIKLNSTARAYAVMPFVWSIGTIIGPAIGGTFANPSRTLPSVFSPHGIFATFPFILPNLICAGLLMISILFGYFFLIETHPDMQPWSTQEEFDNSTAETPLLATAGATANADGVDLRADSYGTFNEVEIDEEKQWLVNADGSSRPPSVHKEEPPKIITRRVLMIVIALGIFTYHSMTYDHLLPIFLQDERVGDHISTLALSPFNIPGGLGLSTPAVGIIMSFNGLIALFIQAIVFPLFATWLGIWKVFVMVTLLHPIEYIIVPYLAFLPGSLVYPGIWFCLTVRNFTSILAYPVILILLKEASPAPSMLGKINGLAASAGAACRTVAPPVAGYLYGLGTEIGFTGLAWWGSAIVAIAGAIQMFWVERDRNKFARIKSLARFVQPTESEPRRSDVVHIHVVERDQVQEQEV